MIYKLSNLIIAAVILSASNVYAEVPGASTPSDQQINDFSLTGYGERGKKSWDLTGKTADIFDEVVKLKDVIGNMYGKEEDMKLTADQGDFNKVNGKIHLQDNVIITTTSGTKLTTDSLDYDRKNQTMNTEDIVNIFRDNMTTVARGAHGETNMKKVSLEKDVRLDILPKEEGNPAAGVKEKIVITCDGPLEVDYEKNVAYFNNNVKVERSESTIYSDKMDVYFRMASKEEKAKQEAKEAVEGKKEDATAGLMGSSIDKIVARGNVKITRGENVSYSDEAIYNAADKKITLNGRPRLILYSTEGMDAGALTGS